MASTGGLRPLGRCLRISASNRSYSESNNTSTLASSARGGFGADERDSPPPSVGSDAPEIGVSSFAIEALSPAAGSRADAARLNLPARRCGDSRGIAFIPVHMIDAKLRDSGTLPDVRNLPRGKLFL